MSFIAAWCRADEAKGRDLVALRVSVTGRRAAQPTTRTFELVDRYDEEHGISAMMRTTGYSLSITGLMQARGEVTPPGVHTPDECIPAGEVHRRACASAGSRSKIKGEGGAVRSAARAAELRLTRATYSRTNSAIVAPI